MSPLNAFEDMPLNNSREEINTGKKGRRKGMGWGWERFLRCQWNRDTGDGLRTMGKERRESSRRGAKKSIELNVNLAHNRWTNSMTLLPTLVNFCFTASAAFKQPDGGTLARKTSNFSMWNSRYYLPIYSYNKDGMCCHYELSNLEKYSEYNPPLINNRNSPKCILPTSYDWTVTHWNGCPH